MKQDRSIFFYQQTDSTNLRARVLAEQGVANGTLVWALDQSSGRGRLGKRWSSVYGKGLYLSFIYRLKVDFSDYAKITLVTGVAVARFIEEVLGDAQERIALKWPNDLLIDGKKVAGILAEAAAPGGAHRPYVIIGIGVNISQEEADFSEELQPLATSLFIETGRKERLQDFLRRLQGHVQRAVSRFESGQFSQLLKEWCRMDYLYGREITCVGVDGKIISGIALGPDETGVLYLRDKNGCKQEILSGDLRLAGDSPINRD